MRVLLVMTASAPRDAAHEATGRSNRTELYMRWRNGRLEELRPNAALAEYAAPVTVVPAYEAAFRQAAAAAGGLQ